MRASLAFAARKVENWKFLKGSQDRGSSESRAKLVWTLPSREELRWKQILHTNTNLTNSTNLPWWNTFLICQKNSESSLSRFFGSNEKPDSLFKMNQALMWVMYGESLFSKIHLPPQWIHQEDYLSALSAISARDIISVSSDQSVVENNFFYFLHFCGT